jgi:hypothetical protein
MLVKEETIKLKANDQTIILDIVPEVIHLAPKTILNRSSPNNSIDMISITDINPTR